MRESAGLRGARLMLKQLGQAFVFVWRYTPGWTAIGLLLVIVLGMLPLVTLALMKWIVDG